MKKELLIFDIYPKVIEMEKKSRVVFEVLDEKYAFTQNRYFIKYHWV
ncbi:MAG: hypothetical protein NTX05_05315 [Fusobacteria bacterium]|nr:hypothetical protein [Fusobacteriota bacterium]